MDSALWRQLRPGTELENLLPKSDCSSTFVGNGLTDFSIDAMEDVIHTFEWQTEKLAAKLQKHSLQATALNIHWFLFNHIQYHADGEDQRLRSPACSWSSRRIGIDCKSYSIFASCLLLNMGVTHYIRKIKQPGFMPSEFTHVYVVVPKDQQTGNLDKGYYTIDGTLEGTDEPIKTEKSDLKMDGMNHYMLNGAHNGTLQGGINLSDLSKSFSISNFKNLIGHWDAIGGSSFPPADCKKHLDNVDKYFRELFFRMNTATQANDFQTVSKCINEFYGNSKVFVDGALSNRRKGWNSVTTSSILCSTRALTFYRDTVGGLLTAYVADNFDLTGTSGNVAWQSVGIEAKYGFRHVKPITEFTINEPLKNYVPDLTKNIPAFELTAYVREKASAAQPIDTVTFLTGLTTMILAVVPPKNTTGGTTVVNPDGTTSYVDTGNVPKSTSQAGFGWIAGLLLAGAVFYGIKGTSVPTKQPATPRASKKTVTPRKTAKK